MTLSERLADEEERNHFGSLLESTCAAKEMGALVFEDHDAKRLLFLNRVFRVATDQTGHFWEI